MKLKKILALVLALALVCTAFAACGGDTTSSTTSSTPSSSTGTDSSTTSSEVSTGTDEPSGDATALFQAKSVDDAKNINLNAGMEPTGLNTIKATYSIEFAMFKHLYDNLLMLDENDQPQPSAAESFEVSEDNTVYTFKLRQDGKWTNGDPVTANDFAFAWQQVLTPDAGSDYAYFLYVIKNGEQYFTGKCDWEDVGVKVIDDYTLEVTLDHAIPYAEFLFTFGTFAPINQRFYEAVGADSYSTEAEYFCTNGAYAVTGWEHNSQIVMQKNDAYRGAADIEVEQITWKIIKDPNAAMTEFLAGGLDMVNATTGELAKQATDNGFELSNYNDGGTFYIYFNHSNKYLSNANLRQALALAFDKEALVNTVFQNGNVPMTAFTNPAVHGYDGNSFSESAETANGGELTPKNGDVEKAKEYLATALTELNCTVEDLSAALSIDCGDATVSQAEAAFYQNQWSKNLGINVTINPMITKQGSQNRQDGNYVMSLTGWGPDYDDPMTFLDLWVSDSGNNQTFYASEEYDKLIDDATLETDFEKRQGIFYDLEKMVVNDLPVAPSWWRNPSYAMSDKIKGGMLRSTFQDINAVNVKLS